MDFQPDAIDRVIKNAIEMVENSKNQIFEILESAREELQTLNQEFQFVLKETSETLEKVDQLELSYRRSRIRLTEVSRDFVRYKEEDIRQAYEKATQLQLDVMIYREKEMYLKARRNELQKRIRSVESSLERAESIGSQMSVVKEYLSGEISQVSRVLETAKNRQLIGLKIILAQEEERKRIAREIHDGPAQLLANLVLRTEIVERMVMKQEFKMVEEEVIDLKGQVRASLEEMRKVIFNLRPMTLDDLGLVPTLRKYVHDFEGKTQIRTLLEIRGKECRLSSAMEAAIYRLVQEALSNVNKHSRASYVVVEMTFQAQMVKVVIQDNGCGFNPMQLEEKRNDHFGIMGMRERAELLEGRMEINSKVNEGTKIIVHIPTNVDKREE
ncbi:sensor histidine kinase [Paenibacillus crassostreae]|uniref:Signal transduction histidine-protein kinase/phosphatase DegS n=1 Tax=Paenibacillus crassostreae TaxID=1763538 RepID=A0A167D837_9BACL|nr:sensor histidine kinase [Paenibacillus crassostreae]AOZ93228.1 histidine kinase [Paenibacillus crassostreae]OAB74051.1 histidine kinase [Paenibacillus crassostreae]